MESTFLKGLTITSQQRLNTRIIKINNTLMATQAKQPMREI